MIKKLNPFNLRSTKIGYGSMTHGLKTAAYVLIALLVGISPQQAQNNVPSPFGVVEGFWLPELTCELGAGWERIIFDWGQHQPESADDWYTLNVDDRWLKAANACNREIVAIFKNVPAWATDGTPGIGVPRGLDLPIDDPGNVWARFMRKSAEYYASRGVHRFIILNEPDISHDTYGFEFEGELEDYFKMLKVAYLAAKAGNPSAVIHLAGTTYWHDANTGQRLYMDRLLERIAQDPDAATNAYYFDVFSLHIYFRSESVPELVGIMRDILTKNGMGDKAIWINETNAAPTDDPDWPVERPQFQINLDQQAAFLVQAAALGLASGVERIAAYKLWDQNLHEGGESFGLLVPSSQKPRPAFYAWKTVIEHFSGVKSAESAVSDQVYAVQLNHHDKRQTTVLWARTAQAAAVEIAATGEKAYLIDQTGGITVLRPVNGVYSLNLPGARCDDKDGCAVGGNVSIVVQPEGETALHAVTGSDRTLIAFESP